VESVRTSQKAYDATQLKITHGCQKTDIYGLQTCWVCNDDAVTTTTVLLLLPRRRRQRRQTVFISLRYSPTLGWSNSNEVDR